MKCHFCRSSDTKVVDKRETEESFATRRRRECLSCEKRFTTYERVESPSIIVVKKDGSREQFDREKIRKGILFACQKRPVPAAQVDSIVQHIENSLRDLDGTEITARRIGELVMKHLKKVDKVAYIRFASVYKEFADLDEFKEELAKLVKK